MDKLDRINITYHFDDESKSILSLKDITSPSKPNYITPLALEKKSKYLNDEEIKELQENYNNKRMII